MNEKQLDMIESALFDALSHIGENPAPLEQGNKAEEQQRIIDKLRSAHALVRTWRVMARRSSVLENKVTVIPGQQTIPGISPAKKQ